VATLSLHSQTDELKTNKIKFWTKTRITKNKGTKIENEAILKANNFKNVF
jgi:hypothetical protein